MKESKKEKLRIFTISFAITFLVMSLFAVAVVFMLNPVGVAPGEITPPQGAGGAYLPSPQDDLSLLVIGEDTENDIYTFVLIGFYPKKGSIPVAALPQQTKVTLQGSTYTLKELYKTTGAQAALNALGEVLGKAPDRYAVLNLTNFSGFMQVLGMADYQLPTTLKYNKGSLNINLTQGMQQLDSRKAADIIRYPAYAGGEVERCKRTGEVICAVLNQNLPLAQVERADDVFAFLVDLVDTNVSQADYATRKGAADFLARLSVQPAHALSISGSMNAAGNTFTPDENSLKALQNAVSGIGSEELTPQT